MDTEFGEKIKGEIAKLLTEIRDEFLLNKDGTDWFKFSVFPDDEDIPDRDFFTGVGLAGRRKKVLKKITEMGLLQAKEIPKKSEDKLPTFLYLLKLNKNTFEDYYKKLKIDKVLADSYGKPIFYLDKDGNFYIEPKKDHCYPIKRNSQRIKIISYLIDNKDYQPTEAIYEYAGGSNVQSIRLTIGRMNKMMKGIFPFDDEIIQSSKNGSGYRINSKFIAKKV